MNNQTPKTSSQLKPVKLLILRFSSVGDVIQTLGTIAPIKEAFPSVEIHWALRSDLKDLVQYHPDIKRVWALDRKTGVHGLLKLIQSLRKENYTHIYDAHNNLRSRIICAFLFYKKILRRSKNRFRRFLLFQLGLASLPDPFIQEKSFVLPLEPWGVSYSQSKDSALHIPPESLKTVRDKIPFQSFITLIPSAAWELKKWPLEHFKKLIELLPQQNFVILGGAQDSEGQELVLKGQEHRILNLSGQLSLIESCAVVKLSQVTIGNDTGISHAADQMGVPLIQMIGPVLFGYPAKKSSHVMEIPLWCRPCTKDGRGKCKNPTYKKCLYDITPERVAEKARSLL